MTSSKFVDLFERSLTLRHYSCKCVFRTLRALFPTQQAEEQQQSRTPLQIGLPPDTPPQQSPYLSGPCSPPALTVDVVSSSVSSSFSVGGGDRDPAASPLESPAAGRMPYALSVALTDAVVRNNAAELAAALSTGLSPDTSVAWYPPDSLTGQSFIPVANPTAYSSPCIPWHESFCAQ